MSVVRTPEKKLVAFGVDEPNSSELAKGMERGGVSGVR